MTWVGRADPATVSVDLSLFERMLLAGLLEQLVDVLRSESDPALERLLPNAYPDDAEAAAEFRRFTVTGLTERKVANAQTVLSVVSGDDDGSILLDAQTARVWLSTITDLRLTIANRLGIESDDDEGRTDEAAMPLQQSYYWLGELQEMIVQALDS